MFAPDFFEGEDPMAMLPPSMRIGSRRLAFDEYYRCYPVAMMPGPERDTANYGGKVFLPASALDKLTRLHITYPMLFQLINGAKERVTHAGVLEFIAEEGKIYLPNWIMQTLLLELGDLLQIKSTDLPSGSFIKLQPQSTAFLDISDPKAVLENVMRNFACLTTGDTFSFAYNDEIYEMAVLETKPESRNKAISVLETDLEVDFAPPIGYVEPTRADRNSGTSTPRSGVGGHGVPSPGTLHYQGTMAQAINYPSIAPQSSSSPAGVGATAGTSLHFQTGGHKLSSRKASSRTQPSSSSPLAKAPQSNAASSAGVPATSSQGQSESSTALPRPRRTAAAKNGPLPLRLPPGKLFFGYEIKPVKNPSVAGDNDNGNNGDSSNAPRKFQGSGHSLRPGGTKRKGPTGGEDVGASSSVTGSGVGSGVGSGSGNNSGRSTPSRPQAKDEQDKKPSSKGRTLRDFGPGAR